MSDAASEIARRRTFAIISHPDAGKTTLTERLLRAGGAIQLAGNVRAKGERRRTRSDWMSIERERGISVVTSVMTFEYGGCVFNLLDTPGHEDFSEDTYRTLTAVNSAVMVIDAAKGIEARTRKLFEICRMRDIPILTFINKMDRESQDPFALLDEVSSSLALDTAPVTWPVGRASEFVGTYDLRARKYHLTTDLSQSDPRMQAMGEELDLVRAALPEFNVEEFAAGHLTPVFFGSAIKEIGVEDLLNGLVDYGPRPRAQPADTRMVEATEPALTALVFKIQANMDPNHRDRIAFARVCSGRLARGMRLKQVRTGKLIPLHAPQFFFARDRQIADEAFAGDVVGIPNHGTLRIGDTLSEDEDINFVGVPYFAPEILRRVRLDDAMKAKKLRQALQELAEEGVVQLFRPQDGAPPMVGVVGTLQLDVLQARLLAEYGVKIGFEQTPFQLARWIYGDKMAVEKFVDEQRSAIADDVDGDPVFLATSAFMMRRTEGLNTALTFRDIKDFPGAEDSRLNMALRSPPEREAAMTSRTTVTHAAGADYDAGLRGFFAYRDLGVRAASGGAFGAHVIRAVPGEGAKPDWHTHDVAFQMVFVLRGWVEFEYADIGQVRLEAGSSVYQPPGIRHREVRHSDDLEMLEIISPAEFETRQA